MSAGAAAAVPPVANRGVITLTVMVCTIIVALDNSQG